MNKKLSCVAIIPARGNSKRLPKKNIKSFLGKPLIYYTISFAKAQQDINHIVVTTDDPEIKQLAEKLGVEVIDRPSELAGDFVTTASAIKHALSELENKDLKFDMVATLQVTNPLRPEDLFTNCFSMIQNECIAESVISVTRSRLKLGLLKNSYYVPSNYELGQRSQDLEPQYYENGLLYLTRTSLVTEKEDLFGSKILAYEISEDFPVVDIDHQIDFEWGEFLLDKNLNIFKHLL